MKIISLTAENFKRLKGVEIEVEGQNVVVLAGRNAQGKSSVLDAIWAALSNVAAAKETTRPIRDGETKARVQIVLDDIVVTRTWSGQRTELKVTARDGKAKFNSPQKMLDDLIGKLSFDPLAFAHMDDKKQRQTLIDLADIGNIVDQIDENRKVAYDERTEVNREVKRLNAQVDGLSNVKPIGGRVDVAELAGLLGKANHKQALLGEYNRNREEIARLEARQGEIMAEGKTLSDVPTADEIEAKIANADEINQRFDEAERRRVLEVEAQERHAESLRLTEYIEEQDELRRQTLAEASFPVPGLSFDDEGVLYNDVPFKQASDAERLRVSVAMAMALNPKVRVIRLKDGSLLDSDNMALIESMAADNDFQVWVERVDESGEVGVVIEDGMVKA